MEARAGTEVETTEQCSLLACACLVQPFYISQDPCPGLILFCIICYIRNVPQTSQQAHLSFGVNSSIEGSFSQVTLVYIKVTKTNQHIGWDDTSLQHMGGGVRRMKIYIASSRPVRVVQWDYLKRKKKQGLERRLSSLPEDPGLIFSTHIGRFITACVFSSRESSMYS